jgi:hypothetical protein
MKRFEIKLPIIAVAFVMVGLIADFLPHPALGPGLIRSVFAMTFEEFDTNIRVTNLNLDESIGYADQNLAD